MKKGMTLIALFAFFSLLAGGCQTNQGSNTDRPGQAPTALTVYYGTVLKVSDVQIQSQQTGIGSVGGAVVGGIIGSTIGSGRRLATTGGTLAGFGRR